MNSIDLDKRRIVIGLFQRLGQKRIAQLGWEDFIACTRLMPHFAEVQEICESAFIREIAMQGIVRRHQDFCEGLEEIGVGTDPVLKGMIKRERSRYRKVDRSLDNWIITCWVHCGLWLFTNEDRRRLMRIWLKEPAKWPGLSSTEAFRKRCERLGVIGWTRFPSTYLNAPLHYNPGENTSAQIWVEEPWKDIFLPCRAAGLL